MPAIKHHPTCRADYPEKPKREKPKQRILQFIDDGPDKEIIAQCVDCGAFVYLEKKGSIH